MQFRSLFVKTIVLVLVFPFTNVCGETRYVILDPEEDVFIAVFHHEEVSNNVPTHQPQDIDHDIDVKASSDHTTTQQNQPEDRHFVHPTNAHGGRHPGSEDPSHFPKETPPYPFYPFQVVSAVRRKTIFRTRPASSPPNIKQRLRERKLNTFESKMVHDMSQFDHDSDYAQLNVVRAKSGVKSRMRRQASGMQKQIQGNLLPIALTMTGGNGELMAGGNLLHRIAALIRNVSVFRSVDETNEHDEHDMFLHEKDFLWLMENSLNLTNPVMLSVSGYRELSDTSLLMNPHVNEYLNCIDASNQFLSLHSKIECMKRKIFDNNNIFKLADSSRFTISNLPGTLVYADVMRNIEKLVRPENGIAFYSLPMDELSHIRQIVLPTDEYVSHVQSLLNESTGSAAPVVYVVKPDGRIYKIEQIPRHFTTVILHTFPDIPRDEAYLDEISPGTFGGPMLYGD